MARAKGSALNVFRRRGDEKAECPISAFTVTGEKPPGKKIKAPHSSRKPLREFICAAVFIWESNSALSPDGFCYLIPRFFLITGLIEGKWAVHFCFLHLHFFFLSMRHTEHWRIASREGEVGHIQPRKLLRIQSHGTETSQSGRLKGSRLTSRPAQGSVFRIRVAVCVYIVLDV